MVRASLRDSQGQRAVCLVDLSTRGLLGRAAHPPPMGEIIELRVGRNIMIGQVRWSSHRRFGVSLRDRVSVPILLEGGKADASLARKPAGGGNHRHRTAAIGNKANALSKLGMVALLVIMLLAAGGIIISFTANSMTTVGEAMSAANAGETV